jgi:flagellar basal-body rod protein FlgF
MPSMDGIAWAGSAMVAARTRLQIASENLANVSTDGFRRTLARGFLRAGGVEIARVPAPAHGALRATGRDFDLAILGNGAFRVRRANGAVATTRDGAFVRDKDGTLRDDAGGVLLGARGPLHVPEGARVSPDGAVRSNGRVVDRLPLPAGSSVRAGFLESANVDAIAEMIDVLSAERSFESAEKVVAAIDGTRQKSADAARIR